MLHLIRLINFTALRSSLSFLCYSKFNIIRNFFSITLYFWSFLGDLITPLRSNLVLHLIRSIYFTTPRIPFNYFLLFFHFCLIFGLFFGELIRFVQFISPRQEFHYVIQYYSQFFFILGLVFWDLITPFLIF